MPENPYSGIWPFLEIHTLKILTYVKVQQTPNPAAQFPSVVPPTKQRKIKSTAMDIWLHMVTKKAL